MIGFAAPWIERVLDRFKGVFARKGRHGYWQALCPAHDDHNPSLSAWLGRDGDRLVVRCWAGCPVEEVVRAAGLVMGDLFKPVENGPYQGCDVRFRPERRIVATYDYTDEAGKLLFQTCFSPDTEILTRNGWVPFPELEPTCEVAQYHAGGGAIDFTHPLAIQSIPYHGPLIGLKATFCDLLVTPDHRMLGKTSKGYERVYPASSLAANVRIPVAGFHEGSGDGPTDEQARVLVAYQADGHKAKVGRQIKWQFAKQRKVCRLRGLLAAAGMVWKEYSCPSTPGKTFIIIDRHAYPWIERWMPNKHWEWHSLSWPLRTRRVVMEELVYWDGTLREDCPNSLIYCSAKKINADLVAAMGALSGYAVAVTENPPVSERCNSMFVATITRAQWRALNRNKQTTLEFAGTVHCCSVPSGFIVVRRNGKVAVAGNCRYEPKDFRQRRPDDRGGWLWNLDGVRLVPYRLHEIVRRRSAPVVVVEGERDVQSLEALGLLATCNPGGTGMSWLPEYSRLLLGRRVAVIPDDDQPGRKHAERVVGSLLVGGAESVRYVGLGGAKDVTEFLELGSLEDLLALVKAAPEWRGVTQGNAR
jgi:hypothetical protein